MTNLNLLISVLCITTLFGSGCTTASRPTPGLSASPPSTQPGNVLYRQALSDDREIVVTKDPPVPASSLEDLLAPGLLNHPRNSPVGFFSLHVDLHTPSHAPLRLWSQIYTLYGEKQYAECQVLDLLVLPGGNRLVMSLGMPGSSIAVVQVGIYASPSLGTSLRPTDWSLLAASVPAKPGRLGAKLAYNEKEKRIEVEVIDFLDDTKQHTVFHQKDSDWEFVRVKRWEEKVPPARG